MSKAGKFRSFLENLKEETTSGDIATVDNKMDFVRRNKHLEKGKKCTTHKRLNCNICNDDLENKKWN